MVEFKTGMKLKGVYGPPPESYEWTIAGGYESIAVVLQNGQMAGVPWAECRHKNGDIIMLNLALMESVIVDEEQS